MIQEHELLAQIKHLVSIKQYHIRIHAVRRMVEEGFSEDQLIAAITERVRY